MRLIDADKLLNQLPNDLPYKAAVKRVLIQAAAVDAVPVVRCQNCKYYTDYGTNPWCEKLKMEIEPEFYCGFGEKYEWCNGVADMMILGTKADEERDFYSGIQNEEGK